MLNRFICIILGHRYIVERVISKDIRKVVCTRCNRHWGMHDGVRAFIPWDGELEKLHETD